ncbi:MAG TPA: GlsB/YeaQ/YmgE family stress response membrane protein [Spirochaetota bacterium]|nr:GlsB/YeaQ/YmgE family stress response membrane protein [Spirochaetota bacterium]HPC43208.1 GlsB/YeaQ/YmgE family stress response membrane protein [Spirochaetota bacterium]HPL19060.1 GlsB/YeaQ/YmgE family stress response membrane protein [Spirochaetota bacterium]HQF10421.1 GlsB/YeaQ/YmgE family stress response membrane protein [Spirochaetota bacterium]HQH99320.1 GlsB/YeaQ/YmgE family stress response membrane protein [Spirochaetota bacterium]
MTLTSILILVAIGLVAGWLAGMIWKGGGFGILWNIIIGVAGSFLGGWIFRLLGISYGGIIGSIVAALVGALILLAIVNLIRRRR